MKKILTIAVFVAAAMFITPRGVHAAFLKFDKTTTSVAVGATFTAEVVVDAAGEQISSTDAYVTYDSSVLQAVSVANGTFFPTVFNDISTSRVYVAGMVDDPGTSKTGTGTVGTITFKALKAGTVSLAYKCDTSTETSKIIKNDFNATNIINCGQNTTLAATVGGAAAASPTSIATSSATTSDAPVAGVADHLIFAATFGIFLLLAGLALPLLL